MQALDLARAAYTHGLTNFIQVLDAQRTLATARTQVAQSQQTIATDLISLYKALGGGWQGIGTDTESAKPALNAKLSDVLSPLARGRHVRRAFTKFSCRRPQRGRSGLDGIARGFQGTLRAAFDQNPTPGMIASIQQRTLTDLRPIRMQAF